MDNLETDSFSKEPSSGRGLGLALAKKLQQIKLRFNGCELIGFYSVNQEVHANYFPSKDGMVVNYQIITLSPINVVKMFYYEPDLRGLIKKEMLSQGIDVETIIYCTDLFHSGEHADSFNNLGVHNQKVVRFEGIDYLVCYIPHQPDQAEI